MAAIAVAFEPGADPGNCFWQAASQTPVVDPPDTEPGDCCYAIGVYNCR